MMPPFVTVLGGLPWASAAGENSELRRLSPCSLAAFRLPRFEPLFHSIVYLYVDRLPFWFQSRSKQRKRTTPEDREHKMTGLNQTQMDHDRTMLVFVFWAHLALRSTLVVFSGNYGTSLGFNRIHEGYLSQWDFQPG